MFAAAILGKRSTLAGPRCLENGYVRVKIRSTTAVSACLSPSARSPGSRSWSSGTDPPPRGVGEGQVAPVLEGLGGRDLDIARATLRVVIEGLLASDRHRGHKSFFVKELCYRPALRVSSSAPAVGNSGVFMSVSSDVGDPPHGGDRPYRGRGAAAGRPRRESRLRYSLAPVRCAACRMTHR